MVTTYWNALCEAVKYTHGDMWQHDMGWPLWKRMFTCQQVFFLMTSRSTCGLLHTTTEIIHKSKTHVLWCIRKINKIKEIKRIKNKIRNNLNNWGLKEHQEDVKISPKQDQHKPEHEKKKKKKDGKVKKKGRISKLKKGRSRNVVKPHFWNPSGPLLFEGLLSASSREEGLLMQSAFIGST